MKKSFLGAIRLLSLLTRETEGMPTLLKAMAKLLHATVFARSGLKVVSALLAKSAPGRQATQRIIVAGTKATFLTKSLSLGTGAMLAHGARMERGKVRAKIGRGHLLLLPEAALLPRIRSTNVVPPLLVVESLLLLPASEVSLLQVKLTGLLALDTSKATALILTASTGILHLAGISKQETALKANVNSFMLLKRSKPQ